MRGRHRILSGAAGTAALALVGVAAPLGLPAQTTERAPSSFEAEGPFPLEAVLSAPMPSGLVAAPTGARFAWVQNAEGERNLWLAESPGFEGRPVTRYRGDDGQELTSVSFTPDGQDLVFVRGGAPNRAGEFPNPTSEPEPREQGIWIVSAEGGEPRFLAQGAAPVVSPRGDRIAFLRPGAIWGVGLEDGAEPEALAEIRGSPSSLRWSPDGRRLAFVSARGDHAFVGVVDAEGRELRYLDPSLDRDGDPVWSPDGERIAFLRVPNERDRLPFAPRREALPWSIRVVEVERGEAREVWRAPEGPGSAFQGVGADARLLWAEGDRIVFPWEGDGWLHLYSVSVAGGEASLLTPGAFEVQFVELAPDGKHVIYDSNQDDVDRKHLWRVPADGSRAPEALTVGEGIEWGAALAAEGQAVAFLASSGTVPAHAEVLLPGGERRWLAPESVPERFPSEHLVEPRGVTFPAADGMEIRGQLFLPEGAAPGDGRPGVLFFHGGSRRQMLLGFHHRGYYHNAYALNQYLASRGYVVLSVNYRSGIGYGMEFREALDYGARGASEYNDVAGAGTWLAARPETDPERIGLWGGSYGGYLTGLGLARASDLFAAGVDLHGVHDWNVVIRNFVPSYDPEEREVFARTAFESSPLAAVDGWRSPVLLIHGDDDRNVPFSESVNLAEALRARGVEVESLVFPDEVHGFLLHRNWLAAYRTAVDFLDRKLGGGR